MRGLIMLRYAILLLLVSLAACDSRPNDIRVTHADAFTARYARSRFSGWKIRAEAAGPACDVLRIRTAILIDEMMVETLHYDGGDYDVYEGGVQHFYKERRFRGVVYEDPSGRTWTYGALKPGEAEQLQPCR